MRFIKKKISKHFLIHTYVSKLILIFKFRNIYLTVILLLTLLIRILKSNFALLQCAHGLLLVYFNF